MGPMSSDKPGRHAGNQLRGATHLVLDATDGIAGIVESMQRRIASGPEVLGRPLEGSVDRIADLFYGGFRGVTRLVRAGLDAAIA